MAVDTLLNDVRALIAEREREGVAGLAERVAPADWAALVPRLDPPEVAVLLQWLPDTEIAELLAELEPSDAAQILRSLSRDAAADLLEAMDPDDATDVIDALPDAEAERILVEMEPDDAAELRELLAYPADSAGGIMTPAYVAVAPDLRADQAIAALRRIAEEAETLNYVYVTDAEEHLLGVLALRELLLARPETPVHALMVTDIIRVRSDADQEAAAHLLSDHNLLAIPVVDAADRLLGIITHDDVADILVAEATEDIERLGGSQPLEISYRSAGVLLLVRRRVFWLLALFVAEAYTGTVLRHYDSEVAQVIALSYFIPLLIGTGGNVGSQVTTTLVRALGTGEVQLRDVGWVMTKEITVGLILGGIMAAVAFGRAQLLHVGLDVGIVVALTIAAVTLWSATVASVLPLFLRRLRIDPAVVSAPLITTLVDGTGLVIYFLIAKTVLHL